MNLRSKSALGNLLYYGMRVLVILAIALFALAGDFLDAVMAGLILVLMLIPRFLSRQYRFHLPFELELFVVSFTFLTLFLGSLNNFYERFSWWDNLLHFQSGILLGFIGFILVYFLNEGTPRKLALSPFFIAFFSVCFSMAMSVVWEVYEFTMDSAFGFNMQRSGLVDTMADLIVNSIGAIIVGVAAFVWIQVRRRIPFTPKRLAGSWYDRSGD